MQFCDTCTFLEFLISYYFILEYISERICTFVGTLQTQWNTAAAVWHLAVNESWHESSRDWTLSELQVSSRCKSDEEKGTNESLNPFLMWGQQIGPAACTSGGWWVISQQTNSESSELITSDRKHLYSNQEVMKEGVNESVWSSEFTLFSSAGNLLSPHEDFRSRSAVVSLTCECLCCQHEARLSFHLLLQVCFPLSLPC